MSRNLDFLDDLFAFNTGEPPKDDVPPVESLEEYGGRPDWLDEDNVVSLDFARQNLEREKVEPQGEVGLGWSAWPVIDGKSPAPILANVTAALEHAPPLKGLIGPGPVLLRRPPWVHGAAPWTPREFTAADAISLTTFFQCAGLRVSPSHIRDAIQLVGAPMTDGALDLADEPFMSAAALLRRPLKPRPWLVTDMIPAGQPTELRGDGGLGKSTLALQLAVAVVSGGQWLGQQTARGPAVYLAGEDDVDEIHRRLASIVTHAGLQIEDLADLHVWPLAAENPALVEGDERGKLRPTRRWHGLGEKVKEVGAALVILDSRADVFGGSEIDRGQVRQFVGMQREMGQDTGAAVVMLAHPSLSGMANGSGSSGSTHWNNAVRSALYLSRPANKEHTDADARELSVIKANYAAVGGKLALRWTIGGFVVEEGHSTGVRPQTRQEAEAEADQVFLALLAKYSQLGLPVSPNPSKTYGPTQFASEAEAGGRKPIVLAAAMKRLLGSGKIAIVEEGPPSKLRRYLTIPSA